MDQIAHRAITFQLMLTSNCLTSNDHNLNKHQTYKYISLLLQEIIMVEFDCN